MSCFSKLLYSNKFWGPVCFVYSAKGLGCANSGSVYVLVLFCCAIVLVMRCRRPFFYCTLEKEKKGGKGNCVVLWKLCLETGEEKRKAEEKRSPFGVVGGERSFHNYRKQWLRGATRCFFWQNSPMYAPQWMALLSFLSNALMLAPLDSSSFTICHTETRWLQVFTSMQPSLRVSDRDPPPRVHWRRRGAVRCVPPGPTRWRCWAAGPRPRRSAQPCCWRRRGAASASFCRGRSHLRCASAALPPHPGPTVRISRCVLTEGSLITCLIASDCLWAFITVPAIFRGASMLTIAQRTGNKGAVV